MNETKQYLNGLWIEEKAFDNGGSILKLSVLPDKFIESLKTAPKNEKGYVKLVISKRREVGKNNETHTCYVDTWKPSGTPAPAPTQKPTAAKTKTAPNTPDADEGDLF